MKRVIFSVAVIFAITATAFSQSNNGQNRQMNGANMSEEQQAIVDAHRAEAVANREAFKATLSEEQLAIMNNPALTREERQEALWATFSEEQMAMVEANRAAAEANREAFRSTMANQRQQSYMGNGNGPSNGRNQSRKGGPNN